MAGVSLKMEQEQKTWCQNAEFNQMLIPDEKKEFIKIMELSGGIMLCEMVNVEQNKVDGMFISFSCKK